MKKTVTIEIETENPELIRQAIMGGTYKHPKIDNTVLFVSHRPTPNKPGTHNFSVQIDDSSPIRTITPS